MTLAALGLFAAMVALAGATLAGAAPAPAPGSAGRYVSMGSSYAAGPGVGERDPASGACARSFSNYARQVAARRGYALADVACSGAVTENVLSKPQAGFPPQIEAVTPDTRLVTATIGGNDVAYVANLMGYSCRDAGRDAAACPAVISDDEVESRFAVLPDTLRRMIAEVRRRAPGATLILVGYLPVLPTEGPGCASAEPLNDADAARMAKVAARLDAVMQAVAAETATPSVRASTLAAGHDICAQQPWTASYRPAMSPGWPIAVPYHPNQAGMDHLAEAIDAVLDSTPAGR